MSRKKFFFYAVALSLFLPVFSCSKDDAAENMRNDIVGTWKLTSVSIDGSNADISTFPDLIQFQEKFIFQEYRSSTSTKTRGGWSYEGDMLNISIYLPAAFYVVSITNQNLTLKRYDFNTDGSLRTTIQQYQRTADSEIK